MPRAALRYLVTQNYRPDTTKYMADRAKARHTNTPLPKSLEIYSLVVSGVGFFSSRLYCCICEEKF
jgi:hypothetical protein